MSETVNCKYCRTLIWTTDVPSKKSGFCWRCEIKRLESISKQFSDQNEGLRADIEIVAKDRDRYKKALFKTVTRLRVLLFYFSSSEVETAVARWLEGDEGKMDLLNPPSVVDELLQELDPSDQYELF